MDTSEKVRENRLRRLAYSRGLTVIKNRVRMPNTTEYAGYLVVDDRHRVVAGKHPSRFMLSIDEVERYLDTTP